MAVLRLTRKVSIIAVLVMAVVLGTVLLAQPRSASAHHEPAACQTGRMLTPGDDEKDAIEHVGDEKCFQLSGLEAGKSYLIEVEKVYVKHIHAVYFGGGGIVYGEHSAIADTAISLHDYTHYRCIWGPCPPENKLLSANHAPPGDPSAQIEFTPSGGEELYVMVSGYANATGGFKISLSHGFFRMAEPECGPLGSCLVSVLEIDPCALGGCVGLLSGTVEADESTDAGESEIAFAFDSAGSSDNAEASDSANAAERSTRSGGAGASESAAASDNASASESAAASESADVTEDAAASDNGGTSDGAGASDTGVVTEVTAVSESATGTDSAGASDSAVVSESPTASESAAATDSADATGGTDAPDVPDEPSGPNQSDNTSEPTSPTQPSGGTQPDRPSQPSGRSVEEVAAGDGQGGIVPVAAILAGLSVVLAGGTAGIFGVWKMRWSGR